MTETLQQPAMSLARQSGNGHPQSALGAMAERYQSSQEGLADVIRKTCIKGNCSDAEFRAFVIVANQYGLNPMTKEIHAFASGGSIVPIVGIDGWTKLVNGQKDFDGCEFEEVKSTEGDLGMSCTMYVKNRSHPVRITEWLSECKRNSPPWNTMKRRMLRHRAFIQAARLAFSLAGIYDEDEARDILNNESGRHESGGAAALNSRMTVTSRPVSEGQRLEVDPDAMRESDPVVIDGGETPDPDVSGTEAEPSHDAPISVRDTCESAAAEVGIPPTVFEQKYAAWVKLTARQGKPENAEKIAPEKVAAFVRAMQDRTTPFADVPKA